MIILGKDIRVDGRIIRTARLAGEGYESARDPEAVIAALRKSPSRVDLFTFAQNLPSTSPQFSYPMELDNLAALPVSTFEHWWNRQINGKTRNMVRRAEKGGISVREVPFDDVLVAGISAIYNETSIRQGKPFWHYRKSLDAVRLLNESFLQRSIFIGAFLDGTLIGFAKLVRDEDGGQAGLMQIVSMLRHRDKSPTNALISQAVRSCAERGTPYLVYAKFSYGKKRPDSLAEFKRHNGFEQISVPRYYIPLTLAGRTALRLGLHHKLVDLAPEPVLALLLKLRTAWYARRAQRATEQPLANRHAPCS